MKFELKAPESRHKGHQIVHGTQVTLNGENLSKDVCNVTLFGEANDLFRLEIEQFVRKDGKFQIVGEPGQEEILKRVRKFYLVAPIALDLEVVEIDEAQPE